MQRDAKVFDGLPEGWQYIPDAPAMRAGRWAFNGKSRFSGELEHGLVRHEWLKGTD